MVFADVLNQEEAKAHWRRQVANERVSHAQLLLENEGYGALPLAMAFAAYLNCLSPKPEGDACGQCSSCRKALGMAHPDIHFSFPTVSGASSAPTSDEFLSTWRAAVKENPYLGYQDWLEALEAGNKQGNITATECRSLMRKLSLKAFEGGWKVHILWLADYLRKEGNLLLKLLEEPPPKTLLLLIAQDESMLLPTIRSRTQALRLARLDEAVIARALEAQLGLAADEAEAVAQVSDGSFNRARRLAQGGGGGFLEGFVEWMRTTYAHRPADWMLWADGLHKHGRERQKYFLLYALRIFRETVLVLVNAPSRLHHIESEHTQWLREKFSPQWSVERLQQAIERTNQSIYHIERNVNSKLALFNLTMDLHALLHAGR